MESQKMTKNVELKSAQGPITIERLQPLPKNETRHGQMSYSFTRNCTSLNLQFISVQKMDSVLHSIQRRLHKQKEQRVFAEFIQSNYAVTESETRVVQIDAGQVCFESGSNASAKVHAGSDTTSRAVPKKCLSNENIAVKQLVKELKTCIATLNASVHRDNNVRFINDDKPYFHQEKDKKITTISRNYLTLQNRSKNTNPIRGISIHRPQQLKKMEHKPMRHALKSKSVADKSATADSKKSTRSIVLATNAIQTREILPIKDSKRAEGISGKAFDALALWKSLSEMEKVEELVSRNLQMMNTNVNDQVKAMEKKENSPNIGTNAISLKNFGASTFSHGLEDKSSDYGCMLETKEIATSAPARSRDLNVEHHNILATKFLSPNSDIVATIKKLSNSVVDELLTEVSNEILDLPEAFLAELLETEFANNNAQRFFGSTRKFKSEGCVLREFGNTVSWLATMLFLLAIEPRDCFAEFKQTLVLCFCHE